MWLGRSTRPEFRAQGPGLIVTEMIHIFSIHRALKENIPQPLFNQMRKPSLPLFQMSIYLSHNNNNNNIGTMCICVNHRS